MFKILRRISVGVIPRPDRPWDEDPTSNAPRTSRKRRMSSAERDDDDEEKAGKKVRGDTATPSVADVDAIFLTPIAPDADPKEVKDVTQGVREVELEDNPEEVLVCDAAPEAIPLPKEESGELDELASDDVDETPEPIEDAKASDNTVSVQVAVGKSTPTSSVTEDSEEPKREEGEVREEPASVEPNDVKS